MSKTKFFLFLCLANAVSSAKILGIFPVPSHSHRNLYSSLMKELVQRGHDVTVISPFEEKSIPENGTYRDIILTGFTDWMKDLSLGSKMFDLYTEESVLSIFSRLNFAIFFLGQLNEMTLNHEKVQNIIKSDEKFDLVIITEVLNRAHRALATHFNSSLVLFSTIGANSWVNHAVGNPSPPSYISDMFLGIQDQPTFGQRLLNSLFYFYFQIYSHFSLRPQHNKLIKKYIPNGPDIDDVMYNVSLVLLNSHPSMNQPVPHVPNMIEIGGFHIKPPKKLPQDLQEYLDDAPDGVIYFSLGSNLKSSDLSPEKREIFLRSFAKLKQKVLWKWEEDVLPGQPKNVKISKWLPQQDILAHPNIKLFITHGGLLSTTETIYHGVPVLAIPIFGDQKMNAEMAVSGGFGLILTFSDMTEEKLTHDIEELLNNHKYLNNARRRSNIFHDRLVDPLETAMYWIEYVIRHRGAPHLRVAALDLSWYQYHLLDVIALVTISVIFGVLISYKIIATIFKLLHNKRKIKNKVH